MQGPSDQYAEAPFVYAEAPYASSMMPMQQETTSQGSALNLICNDFLTFI